ncbi:15529_t:CDS:2, partial [Gigaspora rosea]
SAMHEFIARLWTSNTPEYHKLSTTKIQSLVKMIGKKECDATKSNNDTQITERVTIALSDNEYLDQKHGSELTTERIEETFSTNEQEKASTEFQTERQSPLVDEESLKSSQAITSDKMNKEYSKK